MQKGILEDKGMGRLYRLLTCLSHVVWDTHFEYKLC